MTTGDIYRIMINFSHAAEKSHLVNLSHVSLIEQYICKKFAKISHQKLLVIIVNEACITL